jgi:hypothetical protein
MVEPRALRQSSLNPYESGESNEDRPPSRPGKLVTMMWGFGALLPFAGMILAGLSHTAASRQSGSEHEALMWSSDFFFCAAPIASLFLMCMAIALADQPANRKWYFGMVSIVALLVSSCGGFMASILATR